MSRKSLAPMLPADAVVRLYDSHRPVLLNGDYRLSMTQSLQAGNAALGTSVNYTTKPTHPTHFSVAGPRCSLSPGDFHSVFPPQSSRGQFSHVLPHVILSRASLLWERSADVSPQKDSLPWLAIIVLSAAEQKKVTVTHQKAAAALLSVGQKQSISDDVNEAATVLSLPESLASKILPTRTQLSRLAHVRTVNDHDRTHPALIESGVIIANRFPLPEQLNTVHLVSLEGRYPVGEQSVAIDGNDSVHLLSMKSWDIYCQKDPEIDFETLAEKLAPVTGQSTLKVPSITANDAEASAYADAGFIPLVHNFRSGDSGVSWYHGPLLPGDGSLPATHSHGPASHLPVRVSDELLIADVDCAMLDCSYAAAWELGRLLILARPAIAKRLYKWKTSHKRHRLLNQAHDASEHLPLGTTSADPPKFDHLLKFFAEDLGHLAAVPFDYLVPAPEMLPPESLRFFSVDSVWLECLVDGAFSVGRTSGSEREEDIARKSLLPPVSELSGVLIRSRLIEGFPGLVIDGYNSTPELSARHEAHTGQTPMSIARSARLSPDVMLVLFSGELKMLDMHLHAQTLHFGFSKHNPIPADTDGVIDLQQIDKAVGTGTTNSASGFARAMIQGVPLLRLFRETE